MKKIILCAAIVSLLAACSSSPVKSDDQALAGKSAAGSSGASATAGTVSTGSTSANKSGSTQLNPLKDPNNILVQRSVYFAFDQYAVDEKYRAMIQAHATYLQSHPDAKVKLEGNTDERGGAEYNLALGQKRAEAVRKMMGLLGASDKQVEAISFGKEKPKAKGSNEAAWEQNRRTDVHYQGE